MIDDGLGRSGSSIEGRPGFQRLVAEVGLGHVGLVLGVEMSRLARSCRDWHQLLEICALFDTLIADAAPGPRGVPVVTWAGGAPATPGASLVAAADLAAEREALENQWRQRLERAGYEAERARRQYDAVDPENRLVARTLERQWEKALAERSRLESEHEQFRRRQPQALGPAELAAIQDLARDVPAVWHAGSREDRQTIVRLLLERVMVEVIDGSEQVRVQCHWHGGNRTSHRLIRPVARLDQLSTYRDLAARAEELHEAGHDFAAIAAILNAEGWRPAKRRDTFNTQMVRHLLLKTGAVTVKFHRAPPDVNREPDEWTIQELARHLEMSEPTLYTWVQQGRLPSRLVQAGGRRLKLVHADQAAIARLRAVRATPAPWRRPPPAVTPPQSPSTES